MGKDQVRETHPGATGTRARWTYAEFARLPSQPGTRQEIIADQLVVTPSPGLAHQRIVMRLLGGLHNYADATGLCEVLPGPIDVLFGEGDYLEPDIAVISSGRRDILSDRGVEGPPDLVVEVASPSTEARDRGIKLERYRHFRVPEYWIVDPGDRSVTVWRFAEQAKEAHVIRPGDWLSWKPQGEDSEGDEPPRLELDVASLFDI